MAGSERATTADTGTLGKVMALLDIIALSDTPMRFTDILEISGQPRGTLHRQLGHMVREGLLEVDRDGRYRPGLRLLTFAARSWAGNDIRRIAEPHLALLHDQTGETVHFGILQDLQVIYLDKVEGRQSVRMYSHIGNAAPAYCTGVGKAALSTLGDAELLSRAARMEFVAFTPRTHRTEATLLAEIRDIRMRGYALDREEHEAGICCVAAAVPPIGARPPSGISVTGPAYRVTEDALRQWAPLVQAAAMSIAGDIDIRLGPRAKF
ncbi:IclR family transcriptional regulator [Rhizobium tumorigenes]|uniref:IclR family transcriptional regulator n=1 Tax=Rhizobium tumorigenes TaxID=2041385 RepID=A0AAF1K532_9HYPH|nr:IclR family transcriptional regulator [Rhizobium tumorigenes]WFR95939.1 IclR family transcriptional regulator [Rhizobium tumorigenes]